jgi:hypothetical protein
MAQTETSIQSFLFLEYGAFFHFVVYIYIYWAVMIQLIVEPNRTIQHLQGHSSMRWAPSPIDGGVRKWALIARKAHVSFVKICFANNGGSQVISCPQTSIQVFLRHGF